ncbi:hypothetical protein [Endozoicomonas sp. ALC013]
MDASVNGTPSFIASSVKDKFKTGSGSDTLEILITYSSIILNQSTSAERYFIQDECLPITALQQSGVNPFIVK